MFPMQTKTELAKMAVQMVVALKATQIAEQQVGQHTSLDTETIPVKVGAMVAGQLVAMQLRPITNKTVDIVIDKAVKTRLYWKLNKATVK